MPGLSRFLELGQHDRTRNRGIFNSPMGSRSKTGASEPLLESRPQGRPPPPYDPALASSASVLLPKDHGKPRRAPGLMIPLDEWKEELRRNNPPGTSSRTCLIHCFFNDKGCLPGSPVTKAGQRVTTGIHNFVYVIHLFAFLYGWCNI